MLVAQLPQSDQEFLGRRVDAALALDSGFDQDAAGHRVDQIGETLQIVQFRERKPRQPAHESRAWIFSCGVALMAPKGPPVESLGGRDYLVALALLSCGLLDPVEPSELEKPLVGLRSAVAEEDPARPGVADQPLGQLRLKGTS